VPALQAKARDHWIASNTPLRQFPEGSTVGHVRDVWNDHLNAEQLLLGLVLRLQRQVELLGQKDVLRWRNLRALRGKLVVKDLRDSTGSDARQAPQSACLGVAEIRERFAGFSRLRQ
jgi:hypothetical protein